MIQMIEDFLESWASVIVVIPGLKSWSKDSAMDQWMHQLKNKNTGSYSIVKIFVSAYMRTNRSIQANTPKNQNNLSFVLNNIQCRTNDTNIRGFSFSFIHISFKFKITATHENHGWGWALCKFIHFSSENLFDENFIEYHIVWTRQSDLFGDQWELILETTVKV